MQENFSNYTGKYSPLEAVAACERIHPQYFEDTKANAEETTSSARADAV